MPPYVDRRHHLPSPTFYGNYRLISLLYWRLKRGYSQPMLAKHAGLSLATVTRVEAGALAKKTTVLKLAQALAVDAMVLTLPEPRPAYKPQPTASPTDKPAVAALATAYREAIARIEQLERSPQLAPAPEAFADGKIISFTAVQARHAARRGTYKQPW